MELSVVRRLVVVIVLGSLIVASCGTKSNDSGGNPNTPTPTASAVLVVASFIMTAERFNQGFRYVGHVTLRETGTQTSATVQSFDFTLSRNGVNITSAHIDDPMLSPSVNAGTTADSKPITLNHDNAAQQADRIVVTVNYRDTAAKTANGTADISPLPELPTNLTVFGVIIEGVPAGFSEGDEAPGQPVSGADVRFVDGPNNGKGSTTDGNGYFSISGLTSGTSTLRLVSTGFTTFTQSIVLGTVDRRIDFTMQRIYPDVQYTVTGAGTSSAFLTYQNCAGGTSQMATAALPWELTCATKQRGDLLSISAQNNSDAGCITATVVRRGVTLQTSTSCGAYVIATASGSF
jgi:hypothetical protein